MLNGITRDSSVFSCRYHAGASVPGSGPRPDGVYYEPKNITFRPQPHEHLQKTPLLPLQTPNSHFSCAIILSDFPTMSSVSVSDSNPHLSELEETVVPLYQPPEMDDLAQDLKEMDVLVEAAIVSSEKAKLGK
ncbi:hypothetical protein ACLOJK_002920 [Asimina triloba]